MAATKQAQAKSGALPSLPPITVGKYRAVTTLLTTLVDNAQRIFVTNAEAWRAELRPLVKRPLDVKDAAQIAAAMVNDDGGEPSAEAKEKLLASLMERGYEVESDPQGIGVWVFAALRATPELIDSALQFIVLMEMSSDEFATFAENVGWLDHGAMAEALAARASELDVLDIEEIRERLINCVQHAASKLFGGERSPKALFTEVLGGVSQAWGEAMGQMNLTKSQRYLTDSPTSTAGNPA